MVKFNKYSILLDLTYKFQKKSFYSLPTSINPNIFFSITQNESVAIKENITNKNSFNLNIFLFFYLLNMKKYSVFYKKTEKRNVDISTYIIKYKFTKKTFDLFIYEFINILPFNFFLLNYANDNKLLKNSNFFLPINIKNFRKISYYTKKERNFFKNNINFLLNFCVLKKK